MVDYRRSPVLIFTLLCLSVRIDAHGSIESTCPANAVTDLTVPDSSGSEEKTDNIFPPNSTWSRDGKKFGCPCSFKTCISLCCNSGMARTEGRCVPDNDTIGTLPRIIGDDGSERDSPEQNYFLFTNDPCLIGWMASSITEKFDVFENGSIVTPNFNGGSLSNFEEYCLMRDPKSSKYLAKVCRPWVRKNYYEICSLIVAILIMLAIFTAYTIVPELRNLHGLIFRSYVATYILIYAFALGVMYTTELRIDAVWFSVAEMGARYCCATCAYWLNVMSFNIWRSFRDLRSIVYTSKERERRNFICYAIYAWFGSSLAITVLITFITYVPYFRSDTIGESLKQWLSVAIVITALVFNVLMHTSTALNLRKQKKDTAHLVDGVNRHYEVDEQWFNLYLKLFVIMGGHIITWPIWLVWPSPGMTHFLASMEVAQSIFIFIIFVWKDNVKRSICKQLNLSWMQNTSFLRR